MILRRTEHGRSVFRSQQIAGRLATIFICATSLTMVLLSGCADNSVRTPAPTPFFPVQKPEVNATLLLSEEGKLIVENQCLRLTRPDGSSDLLIWPRGYTVRVDGREIYIVDKAGKDIAHVGDTIEVDGGPMTDEMVAQFSEPPLPDNCTGPYWSIGDVNGNDNIPPQTNVPGKSPALPPPTSETEMYARHLGISIEEAERRMKLQDAAGKLDAELSSKEKETFVGLRIEHTPVFKIIVEFTRNGEETIKPYLQPDLAAVVEVRSATYSLTELESAQQNVNSALRELGISFESLIIERDNRVIVRLPDRTPIDEAIRSGKLVLPACVVIEVGPLAVPQ